MVEALWKKYAFPVQMKAQILALLLFLAVCVYAVYQITKTPDMPLPEGFETKDDPESEDDEEEEEKEEEKKQNEEPETRDVASAPIQTTSLTPMGQSFLDVVKASGANLSLVPTEANLQRASVGQKEEAEGFIDNVLTKASKGTKESPALLSKEDLYALYEPLQHTIKPHQKAPTVLPALSSDVSTDKGTLAEKIKMNQIYTPSIRQMIRDDISTAVQEEVNAAENPYEVSYSCI